MSNLKVSSKGSVMSARGGRFIRPGTVLTRKICEEFGLTRAVLEEHIRSGYIVSVASEADPEEVLNRLAPGVTVSHETRMRPEDDTPTLTTKVGRADIDAFRERADSLKSENNGEESQIDEGEKEEGGGIFSTAVNGKELDSAVSKEPVIEQQKSPWILDPATLEGKSLQELNAMIFERDPSIDPLPSAERAKELLSMDFKPETE